MSARRPLASDRTHRERRIVRLTGWTLLLIGLALCVTVAWAAVGFLLMGLGLISLQVAERGRHRASLAVAAPAVGFIPPLVGAGLQPPIFEPVVQRDGTPRQPRRAAWPAKTGDAPYDREAWDRLVASDPDIARLAKVLADYGPQYVDELATNYLAAPDKNRLGGIVDGIIARASGGQPVPPPAPARGSQPPLPRSEAQAVRASGDAKPGTAPPPPPANPADALEASLIAAVEEASARTAGRADPSRPGGDAASRPAPVTRREPEFARVPRHGQPGRLPPLPSSNPSADLEASLIAAVTEASAKRADPPRPGAPPEGPPAPAKREPDGTPAAPPPVPPKAGAPASDVDATLLAALAEISGEKLTDPTKPNPASKEPPPSPADDDLSDMIKKFAPD
ncbi:hypothetical protein [Bradyrhizobium sp. ISRA463]|nr:hypothetical protein [Bradyrhizobium sp. ISRA463]WGS21302.1 hypothetical protein MTX22_06070 [Bradyrhizobium sp. ISRA463]